MTQVILQKIGLASLRLEINSYGSPKEMEKYKEELRNFYETKKHLLSEVTLEAMQEDILRVFESSDEDERVLQQASPELKKFFKKDSKAFYASFQTYLDDLGIEYTENPHFFMRESIYTGPIWRCIDEN